MTPKGVVIFPEMPAPSGGGFGVSHVPALEHVANRPIARHVLDVLVSAGVEEMVFAAAPDVLLEVRACLAEQEPERVRLSYVICADRSSTAAGLRAAAPHVGAAPCIVHLADGLLDEPLLSYVDSLSTSSSDLTLVCQSSAPGRVAAMPAAAGRTNGTGSVAVEPGIGLFGPGALRRACESTTRSAATSLEDIGRGLSDGGWHVEVCPTDGWRRYRGDPGDLLEVNRLALDLLEPKRASAVGNDNRIEGRVCIHETASVTSSVLVGPVIIGEGAEVRDAYIGPYTSVGARARLEGVEIERSIISPDASVMHVGARLVSSLVGRGAHVFRDFSLPRAIRLRVGEGDEVVLC